MRRRGGAFPPPRPRLPHVRQPLPLQLIAIAAQVAEGEAHRRQQVGDVGRALHSRAVEATHAAWLGLGLGLGLGSGSGLGSGLGLGIGLGLGSGLGSQWWKQRIVPRSQWSCSRKPSYFVSTKASAVPSRLAALVSIPRAVPLPSPGPPWRQSAADSWARTWIPRRIVGG